MSDISKPPGYNSKQDETIVELNGQRLFRDQYNALEELLDQYEITPEQFQTYQASLVTDKK